MLCVQVSYVTNNKLWDETKQRTNRLRIGFFGL